MSHLWQHPFVNVFKHLNISTWKKASKEGEVTSFMDKQLKCSIFKLTGSIPAGNYIQLPKTSSQSLGLTGRYLYIEFKPIPGKYFVIHLDVVTDDNLVVRISISNLFKEFKSTSTWLQFPYLCNPAKGSVSGHASKGGKDYGGPAPLSTRWSILCLDFHYILSIYLNRQFNYLKTAKLCANMFVRNLYTSDTLYDPGLTVDVVKKTALDLHGVGPLPKDMAFPLLKGDYWHDHYDLIRFPSDGTLGPFDSIQYSERTAKSGHKSAKGGPPGVISPRRVQSRQVDASKCVNDRGTMIHSVTQPKTKVARRPPISSDLPTVGVHDGDISVTCDDDGDVHVFASSPANRRDKRYKDDDDIDIEEMPSRPVSGSKSYTSLDPDPILKLKRIVGFGGATFKHALWNNEGSVVVYPCHALVVAMKIGNGHQRFFIGHTDKVSCISLNGTSTLLASGQAGQQSVVRVWNFHTSDCLAMCSTHVHSLRTLSFSNSGNVLCGLGKDHQSKNMVVIWCTSRVSKAREITVIAKAHTDVDITQMKITDFDETKMVSCGKDNLRLWRVKEGSLRSGIISIGPYSNIEFTDLCFEMGYKTDREPNERTVYASTTSGQVFEIDYNKMTIRRVRSLLPVNIDENDNVKTDKTKSAARIAINTICTGDTFCVTGSDDGYLRLWPVDFSHVYLEAEHEGPVTAAQVSPDGVKILVGTANGNLGLLDISTRKYTTIMRSHTDTILSVAVDPYRKHLTTVSKDHTIRVWDLDNLQQLYDFSSPQECPSTVTYHPHKKVFACGFASGVVRVFNVSSTTLLAEQKVHRGTVTGLTFAMNGEFLHTCCSKGILALHDTTDNKYDLVRTLPNTVAKGEEHGPSALVTSPSGRRVAFIGPLEFTITVVDARSLDEMLKIDITHLNPADNTRVIVDYAITLCYAAEIGHLLVATSSNKLLKFDARTGKIVAEVNHIHRHGCTCIVVPDLGKHLLTAGDKVLKVWDYNMGLDINFQVFIGHSEPINQIFFTPDGQGVVSVGEAIYLWDFLASKHASPNEGRYEERCWLKKNGLHKGASAVSSPPRSRLNESYTDMPRLSPPPPNPLTSMSPRGLEDTTCSTIHKASDVEDLHSDLSDKEGIEHLTPSKSKHLSTQITGELTNRLANTHIAKVPSSEFQQSHANRSLLPGGDLSKRQRSAAKKPEVHKHFSQRAKAHSLAQRRYTAPPNQAGLKLKAVIGYNGNGRDNMIWQPDTGLFGYTSGCIMVIEDLNSGVQKHLTGHTEEISTIALQHDCLMLASASGSHGLISSQICIWNLQEMTCHKVLMHHEYDVVCLSYSRDDRFLISVGDYRDKTICVWSTYNYSMLTSTTVYGAVHDLKWDPYTVNEFASVGSEATLLFWLLDETKTLKDVSLNVHEAEMPEEVAQSRTGESQPVDFTCLAYGGDSTLYVGTSQGRVSVWDTRHNSCFLHWDAHTDEIGILLCSNGRLLTVGIGYNLRLWSVAAVAETNAKLPCDPTLIKHGGLVMEDEISLDGPLVSAAFDDMLEMGIVGSGSGTLWYVNWTERTSIRLVSGHHNKVNGMAICDEGSHFVSCADDGSVRIWSLNDREQVLQFQVKDKASTCVAFSPIPPTSNLVQNSESATDERFSLPFIVAGYSDGTVRMFDVNKGEMRLKMHPHGSSVSAISFSADGHMILSGTCDGIIAVSSPSTSMTVRIINDHKGAAINNIAVTRSQLHDVGISSPTLWLATSADRRVSVWTADWSKDFCELADWLTFSAPGFAPDGSLIPKERKDQYKDLPASIAKFSPEEPDIIVYVGYGMNKQVSFYSLSQRKVVRNITLTHWSTAMDVSPVGPLIAIGTNERLLKLMDYYEGSFQDFVGHDDGVHLVKFSPDGKLLLTASHAQLFVWNVNA